ncbi:hypothetical protein LS64_007045, partial [Helicobacter saguini]
MESKRDLENIESNLSLQEFTLSTSWQFIKNNAIIEFKNERSEKSQNATKTQNLNLENNQTKTNTRSVVGGFGGLQGGIR